MQISLYLKFLLARVLLAICVPFTPFPDEFWQGPEIAHRDIFGYGHLTWEWTREKPLRNPVYHSFMSAFYWILFKTGMDFDILVAFGPRMIQCCFSALYDIYLIEFAQLEKIQNKTYITLVNYTIWFSLSCFSKTLINSFEACLFLISLYYWMLYLESKQTKHNLICRGIAVLSIMARQSSIIPWVFIWPYHLLTAPYTNFLKDKARILLINIATLVCIVVFSFGADVLYHKKLTWTFYNFLDFNLLSGQSTFYGVHSWHWLFTQAIPFVMLGWTPFIIIGLYKYITKSINKLQQPKLLYFCLFYLIVISLSAHKEDRFILPLFPILITFIVIGIESFDQKNIKQSTKPKYDLKKILIGLAIVSNLVFFTLMNMYQDVGAIKTIETLRNQNEKLKSVEFFTQCHSTPYYSFLHRNIPMRFPDCSPTSDKSTLESYQLQAQPINYITNHLSTFKSSHIVIYDYIYKSQNVAELLNELGYKQISSIYHQYVIDTYFEDQHNVHFLIFEQQ